MMREPAKIVAREGETLLRRLARWGIVLALAVGILPTAAYTVLALHKESADFDEFLLRRSIILSQQAYVSGPLWRFQTHRLTELMEPAPWEHGTSIYRVEVRDGGSWSGVVVAGKQPLWPSVSSKIDVMDGDQVIARIVGERDVGPVMELVVLVAAVCSLLGAGVMMLVHLRAVPFLRASLARIQDHEQELAEERASLERIVGERTAALSESNAKLEVMLQREREINQQQRRFVSVVSHEFRTPLTIIDGAAQRLARNVQRTEAGDVAERVQRIRRAVARMSELIETSLSAARIDAGAVTIARTRVELQPLLQAVCDRARSIAPDFDIALAGADPGITVDGDPRLLDQIFTNLVNNAVKYSGKSRSVVLELAQRGGEAVVSVRDFGIGIPADEVLKVFDRFYRASTAQGLPGTGIGLDLVRELVSMHGGNIEVASEVGVGSTFTVRLPSSLGAAKDEGAVRAA